MNKQSLVEELPMCFRIQGQVESTEKHKNKLTETGTMECCMDADSKSTIWAKNSEKAFWK